MSIDSPRSTSEGPLQQRPNKSKSLALLLLILFGAHRFYLARPRTGLLIVLLFVAYALQAADVITAAVSSNLGRPDIASIQSLANILLVTLPFTYPVGFLGDATLCITGGGSFCLGALASGCLIAVLVTDAFRIATGRPLSEWPLNLDPPSESAA